MLRTSIVCYFPSIFFLKLILKFSFEKSPPKKNILYFFSKNNGFEEKNANNIKYLCIYRNKKGPNL